MPQAPTQPDPLATDPSPGDITLGPTGRRILILMCIGLALVARHWSLNDGLWYDEIAAWRDYAARGINVARTTYFDPANHVLQSMLSAASVDLAGPFVGGELAMRLPSLLASLVAVALIAGLAMAILRRRSAAIFAGVLAAACPVLALSGTEARGYAFMIAGAAGASWAWIRWTERPTRRSLVAYAAAVVLGTWAHPVTACVAAGHAAVAVFSAIAERRRCPLDGLIPPLLAGVLVVIAYLPILPDMLTVSRSFGRSAADQPTVFGPEGAHALMQLGGAWSLAAVPGGLLAMFGAGLLAANPRTRRPFAATVAGGAILFAATLAGTWIYARFSLFLVPAALLAMAAGLVRLWSWRPAVAGAALAIVVGAWCVDLATRSPRQPLREAADWVRANGAEAGDVHVIGIRARVMERYAADLQPTFSLLLGRDLDRELPTAGGPTFVIELYPTKVDASVHDALRGRGYTEAATLDGWIDWTHGDVRIWRRPN
ncbi:MAG: glycosyltransferase family 39 protein [Phycisphaerales bacterium]